VSEALGLSFTANLNKLLPLRFVFIGASIISLYSLCNATTPYVECAIRDEAVLYDVSRKIKLPEASSLPVASAYVDIPKSLKYNDQPRVLFLVRIYPFSTRIST